MKWKNIKQQLTRSDILWVLFSIALLASPSLFAGPPSFLNLTQVFSFILSVFLFLFPFLLIVRSPKIYFLMLSPLFIFNIIEIGHFFLFGVASTPVTYHLLVETTLGEIWQFIKTYPIPVTQAFISLCIPLFFIFYKLPFKLKLRRRVRYGLATLILIIATPFIFISTFTDYSLQNVYPLSLTLKLFRFVENNLEVKAMLSKRNEHKFKATMSGINRPFTLVIVIGESVRRDHMQIYGYPRATTPRLKSRDDLILFTDIAASATRTVPSIQINFSLAGADNLELFYQTSSLLGLAKEAGYYVTWISNQGILSPIDTGPTIISKEADHIVYLNPLNLSSRFDEIMLPELEKALQTKHPKKLIILHMLGSHFNYADRYPIGYNKFEGKPPKLQVNESSWPVINSYDNSIYYLDHFLDQTLKSLDDHNSALIYLSDHGEALLDDENQAIGHALPIVTKAQYEIPLLFWFSKESLRTIFGDKWGVLNNNKNKHLSMDSFFYTVADLLQVHFPEYQANKSFFSKNLRDLDKRKLINIQMQVEPIP